MFSPPRSSATAAPPFDFRVAELQKWILSETADRSPGANAELTIGGGKWDSDGTSHRTLTSGNILNIGKEK
ncbi:hypothetical protein JEQ12_009290 [Ovis aries]|uniref:Uncharacterized protein n=1 Tax=Ovis aries TaxID=9940 RepID=A0A836AAM1_SHEEP|nr:hypothetical protein JEQ12_009290 [Ovis aries]